jgi:hypothetical protein
MWRRQFFLDGSFTPLRRVLYFSDPAKITELAERGDGLANLECRQSLESGIRRTGRDLPPFDPRPARQAPVETERRIQGISGAWRALLAPFLCYLIVDKRLCLDVEGVFL